MSRGRRRRQQSAERDQQVAALVAVIVAAAAGAEVGKYETPLRADPEADWDYKTLRTDLP